MHDANKVEVIGAPGFEDRFTAWAIPGLDHVPAVDGRGDLAVITSEVGEIYVVPSSTVRPVQDSPDAAAYREEWVTGTGRAPSDIYIPEALR